ncbi:MAG: hypothetical protein J2P31_13490, partial [Blastocatellia bacterium]|nr:hypothetical protein [Blastocatellia bacterium]
MTTLDCYLKQDLVAPHATVVCDIGGKGEYERDENIRNKRKVYDFFVCFVSFRSFRILSSVSNTHTTVACGATKDLMQYKISLLIILLSSLSAYVYASESALDRASSPQADSLLQKSVSVRMYDVYASEVLEFLATEFRFPAGIEIESSDDIPDKDKRISIYVFQKPLEFALNEIVKANPRYRWELNDGVVNLLPKDATKSIVETKIDKFDAANMKRIDV